MASVLEEAMPKDQELERLPGGSAAGPSVQGRGRSLKDSEKFQQMVQSLERTVEDFTKQVKEIKESTQRLN